MHTLNCFNNGGSGQDKGHRPAHGRRPESPDQHIFFPMYKHTQRDLDGIEHYLALYREELLRAYYTKVQLELDLPPSILMPDGEEYCHNRHSSKGLKFREKRRPVGPTQPTIRPLNRPPPQHVLDKIDHKVALLRERLLRMSSATAQLAFDFPPSIPMPDGEEDYRKNRTSKMYEFPNTLEKLLESCPEVPSKKNVQKLRHAKKSEPGSNLESVPPNKNLFLATNSSSDTHPVSNSSAEKELH